MNHSLKNPDAHRRLARGANADQQAIKLRKELGFHIHQIRTAEFGGVAQVSIINMARWCLAELGGSEKLGKSLTLQSKESMK